MPSRLPLWSHLLLSRSNKAWYDWSMAGMCVLHDLMFLGVLLCVFTSRGPQCRAVAPKWRNALASGPIVYSDKWADSTDSIASMFSYCQICSFVSTVRMKLPCWKNCQWLAWFSSKQSLISLIWICRNPYIWHIYYLTDCLIIQTRCWFTDCFLVSICQYISSTYSHPL